MCASERLMFCVKEAAHGSSELDDIAIARHHFDGLNILLGKSRRRVKHGRTAVAPGGVHAIELENVKMRGEPQIAVGAPDNGDGVALAGRTRHADPRAPRL